MLNIHRKNGFIQNKPSTFFLAFFCLICFSLRYLNFPFYYLVYHWSTSSHRRSDYFNPHSELSPAIHLHTEACRFWPLTARKTITKIYHHPPMVRAVALFETPPSPENTVCSFFLSGCNRSTSVKFSDSLMKSSPNAMQAGTALRPFSQHIDWAYISSICAHYIQFDIYTHRFPADRCVPNDI